MSKELEALEELRDFRYGEDKLLVCQTEMYSIIKQALIELEQLRERDRFNAIGKSIQYCKNEVIEKNE